jgi:hypothetical protein
MYRMFRPRHQEHMGGVTVQWTILSASNDKVEVYIERNINMLTAAVRQYLPTTSGTLAREKPPP